MDGVDEGENHPRKVLEILLREASGASTLDSGADDSSTYPMLTFVSSPSLYVQEGADLSSDLIHNPLVSNCYSNSVDGADYQFPAPMSPPKPGRSWNSSKKKVSPAQSELATSEKGI